MVNDTIDVPLCSELAPLPLGFEPGAPGVIETPPISQQEDAERRSRFHELSGMVARLLDRRLGTITQQSWRPPCDAPLLIRRHHGRPGWSKSASRLVT